MTSSLSCSNPGGPRCPSQTTSYTNQSNTMNKTILTIAFTAFAISFADARPASKSLGIPGGNTAKPGQIDEQIELVKQLEIKGKTVTVPKALKKDLGVTDAPAPDDKAKKKAEREKRRKARQKASPNNQEDSDK